MNLILIFLTGTLMGAFNFAFYLYGVHVGSNKQKEDGVTVTKENENFIKEMMEWRSYGGE